MVKNIPKKSYLDMHSITDMGNVRKCRSEECHHFQCRGLFSPYDQTFLHFTVNGCANDFGFVGGSHVIVTLNSSV
jgi:hypothetical protein